MSRSGAWLQQTHHTAQWQLSHGCCLPCICKHLRGASTRHACPPLPLAGVPRALFVCATTPPCFTPLSMQAARTGCTCCGHVECSHPVPAWLACHRSSGGTHAAAAAAVARVAGVACLGGTLRVAQAGTAPCVALWGEEAAAGVAGLWDPVWAQCCAWPFRPAGLEHACPLPASMLGGAMRTPAPPLALGLAHCAHAHSVKDLF